MWLYSLYHPLVIFVCQIMFLSLSSKYLHSLLAIIHTTTYTYSGTHSFLSVMCCRAVSPLMQTHVLAHAHTKSFVCFVCNWSSVGTADFQTPAQLTAAPGTVATRKHHTAGEEQARSSTQGEATDKQCTTSEYSVFHTTHFFTWTGWLMRTTEGPCQCVRSNTPTHPPL